MSISFLHLLDVCLAKFKIVGTFLPLNTYFNRMISVPLYFDKRRKKRLSTSSGKKKGEKEQFQCSSLLQKKGRKKRKSEI